jgi:hypothetical protein
MEVDLDLDIEGKVERHPYGTLAAALGIGYVIAGGLFTPLTARILGLGFRVGLRLAVIPLLESELGALAEALGSDGTHEAHASNGRRAKSSHAKV